MIRLSRHARGLVVAVAALVLTAGVAVAARPTAAPAPPDTASTGLDRAAEAAGKTVPVAEPKELPESQNADPDEATEEAGGVPATAGAADHPENHGADVSAAARAATPASADNHGQHVRSIATANHGQEVAAERRASSEKGSAPNP